MVDRFRQGQSVTTEQLNELRDMAVGNQLLGSDGGLKITRGPAGRTVGFRHGYIPQYIMCAITDEGPNGEEDYPDDERYWVRQVAITNEEGDATTRLLLDYADVLDVNGDIVTAENDKTPLWGFWGAATNLSEWLQESHSLSVGTPVKVFPVYDGRLTGNMHWAFLGSSASLAARSGKITEVSQADGPPSAHKYKGVYMDVANEPVWKTFSRHEEEGVSFLTSVESALQTLSGRDANIIYRPLEVDDIVLVTMSYTNLADTDAGEEDWYVHQPIGLDTGEAPDFIVVS